MNVLPIILELGEKPVVVLGARSPIFAKLDILSARGAEIRWYPITMGRAEAEATLSPSHFDHLTIEECPIQKSALAGAVAIIAAAGEDLDRQVALWARELGIPINVVDRPDLSTFTFPAIVDRGDVVVAVSTSGTSPVLARRLRAQIEMLLPSRLADLAAFLGSQRKRLREKLGRGALDRALWENIIDGPVAKHVMEGHIEQAERLLEQMLSGASHKQGLVTLVGAGPGDPDLLTLKALHALQQADIIFYDALVTPEILARARRDARKVLVGKRKGEPSANQADINRLIIMAASSGAHVVRLKGGDPFIFGRGGEEVAALREAGVAVSIIPGITAAIGCAAEAEIPLTFRDEATKVLILTAQHASCSTAFDGSGLGDPKTSLVIYMGLSSAETLRDGLLASGRSPDTPAAVISRGTRPDAKINVGYLMALPRLATQVGEGPAIVIIGSVVARSKAWAADLANPLHEVA